MECENCGGHMVIVEKTPSKIIWKCARCGYEVETLHPASYNDEDSWRGKSGDSL